MRLALLPALVLAAATSRGGCDKPATAYDPCDGKACGDGCHTCPPADPTCFETADLKACDPTGRCTSAGTFACTVTNACAGKACGAQCTYDPPCRMASPPCMMPSYVGACSADGVCLPPSMPPDCAAPPAWGCEGKACGDPCGTCPPGTDPATCPVPTFAPTACDAAGQCVTVGTFTCYDPCAGKACHEACNPCAPGAGACPMYAIATWCDGAGACVPYGSGAACQ